MTPTHDSVTANFSISLSLVLLQTEPDEPKFHARPGCGGCGKYQHEEERR